MVLYYSLPRPRRSISAAAALEDKCDNCRRTGSSSAFRLLQRHGWRPLSPVGQPGEFGHLQKSLREPARRQLGRQRSSAWSDARVASGR